MQLRGNHISPTDYSRMATSNSSNLRYSPCGSYLALTTNDGKLLVYDAKTGKEQNQFVPSAHLSSSACTCLAWMPISNHIPSENSTKKKSRKRKNSFTNHNASLTNGFSSIRNEVVAIGTSSGTVFIYSTRTGDVQTTLKDDDMGLINALVWTNDGADVITGSREGFICKYRVKKGLNTLKFRSSVSNNRKESVNSMALHPDNENHLMVGTVAACSLWDLETKTKLRVFEGAHIGSIIETFFVNSSMFLSAGASGEDHSVTLWNYENESESFTFSANEPVQNAFALADNKKGAEEGIISIGVIAKSGTMYYFEHNSGSRKKRSKKPVGTVQVASEKIKSTNSKVGISPILIGRFETSTTNDENSLEFVHGSLLKPIFESITCNSIEKVTCLVRPTENSSNHTKDEINGKSDLVVPTTNSVTVLAPGPTMMEKSTGTKRKTSQSSKTDAMSMADRLKLLSTDQNAPSSTPPRTDSVLQLLLQGLNNKDRKILESVLERADDEQINNTVKRLPIEAIVPMLEELQHHIQGKGLGVLTHSKWMKSLLQFHTSYLTNSPQCEDIMTSIYAMIENKTKNYQRILQLRGKLDIMVQQMNTEPDPAQESSNDNTKEALLVYHDDSDELNDELDEMLLPVSDTDNEEWEQEESEGEENGVGPNESRVIDVEDSSDGEDVGEGDNDQDQDMEDEQPIVNGVGSASEEEEMEDD